MEINFPPQGVRSLKTMDSKRMLVERACRLLFPLLAEAFQQEGGIRPPKTERIR